MTQRDTAAEITSHIRAALPLLAGSEQRVAEALLSLGSEVAGLSTAEVAQQAGSSPATVVRACKNMGFGGFHHVRLEFARQLDGEAAHEPRESPVEEVFQVALDSLSVASRLLDRTALERAADALDGARRLLLVGNGFSAPPLHDAELRLLTLGLAVHAPSDAQAQQFVARSLGPEDVCLAASYSGSNRSTLAACAAAKEQGAMLVSITSFTHTPLLRLTDIPLVTGPVNRPHAVDPFHSRLTHWVTLQALCAQIAAVRGIGMTPHMRTVVADALVEE